MQGLYGEQTLQIVNDDSLLDEKGRGFLKKYNVASDGGTVPFAATDIPVIVPDSLKQYWQTFQSACDFWNKYVPLLHLYPVSSTNSEYFIKVIDDTSQSSSYVAETFRTYGIHEIVEAYVHLYKGWLGVPDDVKIGTLEHELGHALLTEAHVEEYGSWFIMWPHVGSNKVVLPLAQKATRLLYEHAPGWKP
jgi:hypothetical protein